MTYMKFTIWEHPSLVIITTCIYLVCLVNTWHNREKYFWKIYAFSLYDLYGQAPAE